MVNDVVNGLVKLHFLDDNIVVFMGDTVDEIEVMGFFGNPDTRKLRFPCLQISREHWELCGMPTLLRLTADAEVVTP